MTKDDFVDSQKRLTLSLIIAVSVTAVCEMLV